MGEIPIAGIDRFHQGTAAFLTGWFDGGFNDLDGTLYYIKIDALNVLPNESILVEYRLDNDESAGWTTLGEMTTQATRILQFASAPVDDRGIQFRTVQFRVTLSSGTPTLTPELRAFTIVYSKKSPLRTAWVAQIDVNRMISAKTQVGGSNATLLNVWEALKTSWEKHELLSLVVPNVEPSANAKLVQIADMPITIDDIRDEVAGKGRVDLTLIESVRSS
jgi:hypothetical protein